MNLTPKEHFFGEILVSVALCFGWATFPRVTKLFFSIKTSGNFECLPVPLCSPNTVEL